MPGLPPNPLPAAIGALNSRGSIYINYQPGRTKEEAGVTSHTVPTNVNIEIDSDGNLYAVEFLGCIGRFQEPVAIPIIEETPILT